MSNLIGTAPDQVPVNGLLGTMAFQDTETVLNPANLIAGLGYTPVNKAGDIITGSLAVGTVAADVSALLDIQSTTKGVRMPNMTTTQKDAIVTPAAGLMVFDTTLAKLCVYSGTAWQTITST